jgi:hypothetical protein
VDVSLDRHRLPDVFSKWVGTPKADEVRQSASTRSPRFANREASDTAAAGQEMFVDEAGGRGRRLRRPARSRRYRLDEAAVHASSRATASISGVRSTPSTAATPRCWSQAPVRPVPQPRSAALWRPPRALSARGARCPSRPRPCVRRSVPSRGSRCTSTRIATGVEVGEVRHMSSIAEPMSGKGARTCDPSRRALARST